MVYVVDVQSVRGKDVSAFMRFLRKLRTMRIRAVRVAKEDHKWGHTRSYRIEGRDNALAAYHAAFACGLIERFQ